MDNLEALKRILKREREARKEAEKIIEEKSRELFVVNNQLKELNASLEDQVADRTIELKRKVDELHDANKYKSEFLANMSHELRTPLNSILILAKMLKDNKENNFTPKQIEYANVIHGSGHDLLSLINDILDLAKIEAGRVEINLDEVSILEIRKDLETMFDGLSKEKDIDFNISISNDLPAVIEADKVKLLQILRNLLSNAFKFTEKEGNVDLFIEKEDDSLLLKVRDNGIGIDKDKLSLVFEAFQQADGSTSRRFGGTGLGLSICKELTHLMNGQISLESEKGVGSEFQVRLPLQTVSKRSEPSKESNDALEGLIPDSKNNSSSPILIIEDDPRFVKILQDFAKDKGFESVVATQGDTGLFFAKKFNPVAILLDIQLPVMSGWQVLKELKSDMELSTIPVHIFSIVDKPKLGLEMGAETYSIKPINLQDLEDTFDRILLQNGNARNECMILGKDSKLFPTFYQTFQNHFHNVRFSSNYDVALDIIKENHFSAIMIVDNDLDGIGFDEFARELDKIYQSKKNVLKIYMPPKRSEVIGELSKRSHLDFILDEQIFEDDFGINLHDHKELVDASEEVVTTDFLKGCKVLLVEDEMRNVFVMDSILEPYGALITVANNGKECLEILEGSTDFDIILMDIMMPIMNGFEAIEAIRKNPITAEMKIIAVTAKAMIGDAEKCLEAGANAYVSKPIDIDVLYATMNKLIH